MIKHAILTAKLSTALRNKTGCVITDKKGNILSIGVNNITKTHPIQKKFAKRSGNIERQYLHAEIHALIKCNGRPHTIYVARITTKELTALAKPCAVCSLAIKEAGVKKVVYTDNNGIISEYKV